MVLRLQLFDISLCFLLQMKYSLPGLGARKDCMAS